MFSKSAKAAAADSAMDVDSSNATTDAKSSVSTQSFLNQHTITFELLASAIQSQNIEQLQKLLASKNKQLIDSHGNNILHIAFKVGNFEVINMVCESLTDHLIKQFLCSLNQDKNLPSAFLDKNTAISDSEKLQIIRKIIAIKPYPRLKQLGEPIDEKEIMSELGNYSQIQEILEAMNETRTQIIASTTHPDVMMFDEKERGILTDKYDKHHKKRMRESDHVSEQFNKTLEIFNSHTVDEKIGTCSDFSHLLFSNLRKNGVAAEVFETDGDHLFIVANRNPNSDPEDFKTWGDALVCDAWSGQIFPAGEIPMKLHDYAKFSFNNNKDFYIIVYPFNPQYQKINAYYPIENYPEAHEPPAKRSKSNSYHSK